MSRREQVLAKATVESTKNHVVKAVQKHLDDVARSKNYDGILSLCTYATSLDPIFSKEGQAGVVFRDDAWRYCYKVLGDVTLGYREMPTIEQLLLELPEMVWPD